MKFHLKSFCPKPAILLGVLVAGMGFHSVLAETVAEIEDAITKQIDVEIGAAGFEADTKEAELRIKYVAALKNLETKITRAGNLDDVLRVREEIAAIDKSGNPTSSDTPKGLVDLRTIYLKSKADLQAKSKAAADSKVSAVLAKISERESALTRQGEIDQALALRELREKMNLKYLPEKAEFKDSSGAVASRNPAPVKPPEDTPPAMEDLFGSKEWMESCTVPIAKQRIREQILLGDRGKQKWPVVVVSPGSIWSGTGSGQLFLSAARIVARQSKFEKLKFINDLSSHAYFIRCELLDTRLERGGIWWGGNYSARFYLEDSLVKGTLFPKRITMVDYGVRADRTVFVGIELPEVGYEKEQPARVVQNSWFCFVNCRFVKCKIPASFLLATYDCVFEDCTFVDDENPLAAKVTESLEAVVYARNCKNQISELQAPLAITVKPDTDLRGVEVPTEAAVSAKIAR
jgi:hypothetical protein